MENDSLSVASTQYDDDEVTRYRSTTMSGQKKFIQSNENGHFNRNVNSKGRTKYNFNSRGGLFNNGPHFFPPPPLSVDEVFSIPPLNLPVPLIPHSGDFFTTHRSMFGSGFYIPPPPSVRAFHGLMRGGVRRRANTPPLDRTASSTSTSPQETRERIHKEEFRDKINSSCEQSKFAPVPHINDSSSTAPLRSMKTESGAVTYPLIYVSPAGTISVVLSHDVIIEMAVDRSIRVVCHDNFAAFINSRGTSSSILHTKARILHTKESVYSKFSSLNDKLTVFGVQGILFTMSHLREAYLVSNNIKGASVVALDQLQFSLMDSDYTVKLFYKEAQSGNQFMAMCKDIVHEASYERKTDGTLIMHINGMVVRQTRGGDVTVDARPRIILCSPSCSTVHVRSAYIDMGIQEDDKAFVKRGLKRVHVSRSGMVVSDGNSATSMDHFGRIVSCT